jgi:DNA-binding transcriptional LysR family regulator
MLYSNYLKQLDLQDIVVFLHLLEQRSAKRTAEIMSVSQPTVSYCLKRLRTCFDDMLFASAHGLMSPTSKAEKIAPYLRMVVESVNRCAEEEGDADTVSSVKVWQVCAPEYFELTMVPIALRRLLKDNPNVSLHLERLSRNLPIDRLLLGEVDLAIGFGPGYHQMHPELQWESVLTDRFVCLTSQPREETLQALSLDEFCSTPHVFPTPWVSDKNMVDSWLEKIGRSRQMLAKANTYQACINIIAMLPATCAIPSRLVSLMRLPPNVQVCEPPLGFPTFTLDMIWCRERCESKEIRKLRDLIHNCAIELG